VKEKKVIDKITIDKITIDKIIPCYKAALKVFNKYADILGLIYNSQLLIEYRDALDHLMRFYKFYFTLPMNQDNANEELDKILGHLRRVFFDICDYIGIVLRNKIDKIIYNYNQAALEAVLEDYKKKDYDYSFVSQKIASYRIDRVLIWGGETTILDNYMKTIDSLYEFYIDLKKSKFKLNKYVVKSNIIWWLISLIGIGITVFFIIKDIKFFL